MKVRDIIIETEEIDYAGLCGKLIDTGSGRLVYEHRLDPHQVVKVHSGGLVFYENHRGAEQNGREWDTWQQLKDGPLGRHFAPCHSISADCRYLLQERTQPATGFESLPVLFLAFDVKLGVDRNYGIRQSRPVCHDYGVSPVPLAEFAKPGAAEVFGEMLSRHEFAEARKVLQEWFFDEYVPDTAADFADLVAEARENLAA